MSGRKLTNKQVAILELLRREGKEMTVDQIAEIVGKETPCSHCGATGDGDERVYTYEQGHEVDRCGKCYGRGHAFMHYSDAYQALKRLRAVGLVTRRCQRDEWGDELPRHVYRAADAEPADSLEEAWNMPAVERA